MNSSPLIEKPMLDGSSGNESYEMIYFRENLERISEEEFLDPDILETGGGDVSNVIDESENDMMYFIFNHRDVSFETLINVSPRSNAGSAIPLSRNFNYVGKSAKRQVRISEVPVLASFQRGQYQLKCIKLNKYQPVECFELLDAGTGLRANRSSSGKSKDDTRNVDLNANVSTSFLYFSNSLLSRTWIDGWGSSFLPRTLLTI
jgi:hypothetical protein